MTATLDALLTRLDVLLERENDALTRMDVDGVSVLVAEKNDIAEQIRRCLAETAHDQLRDVVSHIPNLRTAMDRNKTLLERALRAQRRVVGLLASASRPVPTGYGRRGRSIPADNQPRAMIASA